VFVGVKHSSTSLRAAHARSDLRLDCTFPIHGMLISPLPAASETTVFDRALAGLSGEV
jgi:hypothetical protein